MGTRAIRYETRTAIYLSPPIHSGQSFPLMLMVRLLMQQETQSVHDSAEISSCCRERGVHVALSWCSSGDDVTNAAAVAVEGEVSASAEGGGEEFGNFVQSDYKAPDK